MKNMTTRIAKVCNMSGFRRRINGFNLRINQNHAHPKIISFILLSALLLCIPVSVYSAITTSIAISSTGQIATVQTLTGPYNTFIGQYANGGYYAINLGTGQTYATAPSSASQLINNAIVRANSNNDGGTVQIGSGSFLLTSTIVPLSNVYLQISSGATLYQNPLTSLSQSISLVLTTSGVNNFTLNGGTWNGNKGTLSDFRTTSTWGSYFFQYFGIGVYTDSQSNNVVIENVVLENVVGQGIDLRTCYDSLISNCSVINAGDNPISIEASGTSFNSNSTVQNCYVNGGQDVGINSWTVSHVTLADNTVTNIVNYTGASHWGIAAEQSNNINIIGNTVTYCDFDIVSTSNNVLISQNHVDGLLDTGPNYGIQVQTSYNNTVIGNTIADVTGCTLSTYGPTQTYNAQFINNTCSGTYAMISGTGTTVSGGTMTDYVNWCLFVMGVPQINITGVSFFGNNGGICDYGDLSNNTYIANCNFTGINSLATPISMTSSYNTTLQANIGLSGYQTLNITTSGTGTVAESCGNQSLTLASGNLWQFATGTSVTITATPTSGSFLKYTFTDGTNSTSNPLTFSMNTNKSVTAYFG